MSKVPLDVITDVFQQLPVESLLRFRCLSKPLCSLIDSRDFADLHLAHSVETKSNLGLILKDWHLFTVDLESLEAAVELQHPLRVGGGTEAVGSCNGLVAMRNSERDVALYNPSTRRHKRLPVSQVDPPDDSLRTGYVFYGFGYDSVHDDYKVVRMAQFVGQNAAREAFEYDCEVKVYSLKSDSWKRIKDLPLCLRFINKPFHHVLHKRGYGVFAGPALHWVVPQRPELGVRNTIIAFDIVAEKFHEVPQPEYEIKNMNYQVDVGVLEGCLCVMCNYEYEFVHVWVMKEYLVKDSWTKMFTIRTKSSIMFLRPLTYSKDGEKVLFEMDDRKLVWYDLNRKSIKNVRISGAPKSFGAEMYVQSLVPLPDGGVTGQTDNQEQEDTDKKKMTNNKRDDFLSVGFKLKL